MACLFNHALFPIYEYAHTKHIARHHSQKLILVKFPDPLTNTRRWKFAHNHRRDANQAPKTYTHTRTHSHANITRHTFERRCGHHHGRADDWWDFGAATANNSHHGANHADVLRLRLSGWQWTMCERGAEIEYMYNTPVTATSSAT